MRLLLVMFLLCVGCRHTPDPRPEPGTVRFPVTEYLDVVTEQPATPYVPEGGVE